MVIGVVSSTAEEPGPSDEGNPDGSPGPSVSDPERVPARSGPPLPGVVPIALSAVMVLSIAALFVALFAFGLSGFQEQRSQHQLYATFRGLVDPASIIAPKIGGDIPVGYPVALVNAPSVGMHNVMVVEGTSSGTLLDGPGHLRNTPLPGQPGEPVLMGKGVTAGAPFGAVNRLHKGDVVTVLTGQGTFRYVVGGRLAPGAVPPSIRSDQSLLVLVTSSGSGGLSGVVPDHLTYVDAKLEGKVVPAPHGRPRAVTTAELPGHIEVGAWPFVVLWLLALGVGSVLFWRLWAYWGLLRTWLIGAPVLVAILWGLSNEAMRLVPNVY